MDRQARLQQIQDAVRAQVEPGETLQGMCYASEQRTFSGTTYVIGVTDRRLLLQALNRKAEPDGPAEVITPTDLASVSADGGVGGWASVSGAIADMTSIVLKLKTHDGRKHKLNMLRGDGPLGALAGEGHADGFDALSAWLDTYAPR